MKPGNSARGSHRHTLGLFGERQAEAYLYRQGYTILERNWRCHQGELDLVARHNTILVFVEVRTRQGNGCGSPEESVGPRKQARLVALAYAYFEAHPDLPTTNWRIDLVAIEVDSSGRVARLTHLPHAIEEQG